MKGSRNRVRFDVSSHDYEVQYMENPSMGYDSESRDDTKASILMPSPYSFNTVNDTAVCLIGLQNEYAKKGGKLYEILETMITTNKMIPNIQKIVDLSRQRGFKIIHSPYKQIGDHFFCEGTWNSDFIDEVKPMEGDIILSKNEGSIFEGTDLDDILVDYAINRVFFLGLETKTCADAVKTAQKILPGVESYVVSDGCASKTETEHNEILSNVMPAIGGVVTSYEVENMIDFPTQDSQDFRASTESISVGGVTIEVAADGGDEWKIVDDIFEIGDISGDGKLELYEIKSLLRQLSDGETVEEALLQQKIPEDKLLSKNDLYDMLFKRQTNKSLSDKISLFLIMWVIPLLYSFSTRIPFICVALEVQKRIFVAAVEREEGFGTGLDDVQYLTQVGYVLAAYQTCRSIANSIISILGGKRPFKRLEIPMLIIGLFGFAYSYNFSDESESWVHLFAFCGVGLSETVVNLQSALVRETKMESPSRIPDKTTLSKRMRLQYSAVAAGSFFAYVWGGQVYTRSGFKFISIMGIISQSLQIIFALIYLKLMKEKTYEDLDGGKVIRSVMYQLRAQRIIAQECERLASDPESFLSSEQRGFSDAIEKANENKNLKRSLTRMYRNVFPSGHDSSIDSFTGHMQHLISGVNMQTKSARASVTGVEQNVLAQNVLKLMQTGGSDTLTEKDFVSYLAPRVYLYFFGNARQACVTIIWPYMKVVVLTQAVMALCIGTFLSTSLLFYTKEYNMKASEVGVYLGVGEGLGAAVIFGGKYIRSLVCCVCSSRGKLSKPGFFRAIISRPLHVPAILVLLGTSTICFSIKIKYVSIAFQLMMSCVNDLSVSLLNELLSTSLPIDKFKKSQGFGQVLRRLGNMTTGLLGPILFGLGTNVPFLVFGGIVNVWSLILFCFLRVHAGKVMRRDEIDPLEEEHFESNPKGLFEPFYGTATTPWHIYEENYFKGKKREIERRYNPTERTTLDNAILEHRMRRIQAALQIEQMKRHALQEKLIKDNILKYE